MITATTHSVIPFSCCMVYIVGTIFSCFTKIWFSYAPVHVPENSTTNTKTVQILPGLCHRQPVALQYFYFNSFFFSNATVGLNGIFISTALDVMFASLPFPVFVVAVYICVPAFSDNGVSAFHMDLMSSNL